MRVENRDNTCTLQVKISSKNYDDIPSIFVNVSPYNVLGYIDNSNYSEGFIKKNHPPGTVLNAQYIKY